jgi:putative cell wall-binding protein
VVVPVAGFVGQDRFATAVKVSQGAFGAVGSAEVVFVANGWNFPDGLVGAGVAARLGGPVLLVDSGKGADQGGNGLVLAELGRLKPKRIVLLGSEAAVPGGFDVLYRQRFAGVSVERWAGVNRFETAVRVSQVAYPTVSGVAPRPAVAFVATGGNFPDALAAAGVSGKLGGPVLLVDPGKPADDAGSNEWAVTELARLAPGRVVLLGSEAAVPVGVEAYIQQRLPGVSVTRLAGVNRYDTAVRASQLAYPSGGVEVVFVTTGLNYPDAVAGAGVASKLGGPVLLIDPSKGVDDAGSNKLVFDELRRLKAKKVIVLGGDDAKVVPGQFLTAIANLK